jgi:endonuclease G
MTTGRLIAAAICAALMLPAAALANPIDDNCPDFVLYGAPVSHIEDGQYLCRLAYGVHYSFETKTAEYVVEHITKQHLAGKAKRKNNFHEDPEVAPEHRSTLKDFKQGSKTYDRGHMAPAEDFKFSVKAMSESFLLSNMVPQVSGNNRGIWSNLEQRAAKLTRQLGETYVISGPIYDSTASIGNGVRVPQRLFKIVVDPKSNHYAAFILPNVKLMANTLAKYATSIKAVEDATGLQLFPYGPIDKASVGTLELPPLGKAK